MAQNIWYNNTVQLLPALGAVRDVSTKDFHRQLPSYQPSALRSLEDVRALHGLKEVFIKDESNRFGLPSFKILGASWGCYRALTAKLNLPPTVSLSELKSRLANSEITLYAATDGNHGRAVAFMARLLGIKAVILVPKTLDQYTKDAISSSGGKVVPVSEDYDGVVKEAERRATASNGILIQDTSWPEYEEIPKWIVEGYSTIFSELEDQLSGPLGKADLVIVPVGVGSLAHAAVQSLKQHPNGPRVVVIEPESAACLNTSLRAGHSRSISTSFTIMTGMNCGTVSYTAWDDLKKAVDISLTVSDAQAHNEVEHLHQLGINAGPCGAAGVAAIRILAANKQIGEHSTAVVINTEGRRPYESFGIPKENAPQRQD